MRSQELALTADPQRQPARPQPGRNRPRQGAPAVRALQAARRARLRVDEDVQRHQGRSQLPAAAARRSSSRASRRPRRCRSSQLAQLRAASTSLNSSMGIAREQPRPAQHPRAGHRRAQRLRHPARPVAAAGRADRPDRQRRRQQAAGRRRRIYLGRVQVGQTATADVDGKTYRLKVAKVYPQVRNGQFQIDLVFDGPAPARSSAARRCRPS